MRLHRLRARARTVPKIWSVQHSRELYSVSQWSSGYFDIGETGHVIVRPKGVRGGPEIDLFELACELNRAGQSYPVLVRFTDILHHRVDAMCEAFTQAMQQTGYEAPYTAAYPIKVNQQRYVIEEILKHGGDRVALEVGSKPELMAVLALAPRHGTVICNGYKDQNYIRLALIGKRLGLRVYLVVEKLSELEVIVDEVSRAGIEPLLGIRVRLASIGTGNWQNTGGEKSKFGLLAEQVYQAIGRLKSAGLLSTLQMMHFHIGSQIPTIRDFQRALREGARYYAELRKIGANIVDIDVGGGLGVDYDGTQSHNACSMDYSVQEYADNVVHALWEICNAEDLPYPQIITESGRAMTAHHAVLVTNVVDIEQASSTRVANPPKPDEPQIIKDLWQAWQSLKPTRALEAYHDAEHWLLEARAMFIHGVLNLAERARVEHLYNMICRAVRDTLKNGPAKHQEVLKKLNEKLADKYFCNFSVFQSIPDTWAIEQVFPIMPLHRLQEHPTQRATIQDLTCDSDGRIDLYVDTAGLETSLPIHASRPGERYLLGVFLLGAYQEILGDVHNLFGDTGSVNVELSHDDGYRTSEPHRGDTVAEMLRYVNISPEDLQRAYRDRVAAAELPPEERERYLATLIEGLGGYTYLEDGVAGTRQ
ncbi:MAG: biosynthetic arginine decarboxylase [Gammaproteobacteria bacterium]|nr:biosynthetic arginine decarboxylase [Gammaproteobacteria bacterium]MCI0591533.1 biosynthetic arginine decarboxylase [Gammaproteobacteria bacterium]